MKDKLTYKDYKQSRNKGNVIMSPDGSLYVISNMWLDKLFAVLSSIPPAAIPSIYLIFAIYNRLWLNLMFECGFAAAAISPLFDYTKYRLLLFVKLEPGSRDYQEANSWFKPERESRQTALKILGITARVIIAGAVVFALLNSHTAELVRSLFDSQPRVASFEVNSYQDSGDVDVLYSASTDPSITVIHLPSPENSQIYVNALVSRTLTPAQLTLDGKPLTLNLYVFSSHLSWFWEPEYLKQGFRFYLDDIRDGSTLTLTCGGLTREWVFEVAD